MISEPYINTATGEIMWFDSCPIYLDRDKWIPYADHERGKLKEIKGAIFMNEHGYVIFIDHNWCHRYLSRKLIGYRKQDHRDDSESNRLLKRAEFLKAVCKKEGVGWLDNKATQGKKYKKMKEIDLEPFEKSMREEAIQGNPNVRYCHGCNKFIGERDIHPCEEAIQEDKQFGFAEKKPVCPTCNRQLPEVESMDEDGTVHLKRDYYTKGEVDEKMRMACICQKPMEEEKEWRKALLDFLRSEMLPVNDDHKIRLYDQLEDLRSRFTV